MSGDLSMKKEGDFFVANVGQELIQQQTERVFNPKIDSYKNRTKSIWDRVFKSDVDKYINQSELQGVKDEAEFNRKMFLYHTEFLSKSIVSVYENLLRKGEGNAVADANAFIAAEGRKLEIHVQSETKKLHEHIDVLLRELSNYHETLIPFRQKTIIDALVMYEKVTDNLRKRFMDVVEQSGIKRN